MQKAKLFIGSKVKQFVLAERPVLHTAWQAGLGVLAAGLVTVRSTADVKALVVLAVTVTAAAAKAAVKAQLTKA